MSFANVRNNPRWQPEEDDFLIAVYGTMTARAISDSLPLRSESAVVKRAVYLELKGRGRSHCAKSPETRQRVLLLAAQGLNTYEIADQLGVSQSWAHNVIAGNATYHRLWSKRESERRSDAIARSWKNRRTA